MLKRVIICLMLVIMIVLLVSDMPSNVSVFEFESGKVVKLVKDSKYKNN